MKRVLILLGILCLFGLINARIVRVPEDVQYNPKIQEGINRANAGDTVSVWIRTPAPPDTYYENIDFVGKALFIVNRSFLPGQVQYDSSWDHIVINGNRNQTSTVKIDVMGPDPDPGVLKGFTVTGGTTNSMGGGVEVWGNGWIIKNLIVDNHAQFGGGIHAVTDFYNITRIIGNLIKENTSEVAGGGLYVEHAFGDDIIIENNDVLSNTTGDEGAGICYFLLRPGLEEPTQMLAEVNGNLIRDNKFTDEEGLGGGIYYEYFYYPTRNPEEYIIKFRRNVIQENYDFGFYLDRLSYPGGEIIDLGTSNDPGFNTFIANENGGLYNNLGEVTAKGNYWGSIHTPAVRGEIHNEPSSLTYFDPVAASDRVASITYSSRCSTDVIVTGDLTVTSGDTLTIAAGKTFKFTTTPDCTTGYSASQCELLVNGNLKAVGTQSNQITFTSFATSPQPGDWYGVKLGSNSKGSFNNCLLKYAYSAIDAGENSHLTVDTSTLKRNQVHGIKIWGADSIAIKKSEIDSSIYGIYSNQSPVIINNSKLQNNYRYGIILENTDSSTITGNLINGASSLEDTTLFGIYLAWVDERVSVNSNRIENWDQGGIHCYETQARIKYDTIHNNLAYGIFCDHYDSSYVRKCRIDNNKAGVQCQVHSYPNLGIAPDSGMNSIDTSNYYWVVNYDSLPQETVKAEYNWWGVSDPRPYRQQKFLGLVDYIPWLTTEPQDGGQSANVFRATPTFVLYMPKPNPAKNSVKITYSLPNRCKSELVICDILGRIITNLTENKDAGTYEYLWQGKDQRGKAVPNGVYLVRLKTSDKLSIRKVVLSR